MSPPPTELHRLTWGIDPAVVVRAPGRVNLMGDHVDYALLPVLPIAIQLGVRVGLSCGADGQVRAISTDAPGTLRLRAGEDPLRLEGWARYVAAAVRTAGMPDAGVTVTVTADLPSGGGLSSSSALVLAVVAGLLELQERARSPGELAALGVTAERSLGVEGGTMDQTVILHAAAGCALRIEFAPVSLRLVPVPEDISFVVAYSGATAAKGGAARDAYNTLSIGARVVAALTGRLLGMDPGSPPALGAVGLDAAGLDEVIGRLPPNVSLAEAARAADRSPVGLAGSSGLAPTARLPVAAIGSHLVSEALRVDATEAALQAADAAEVGSIMLASHESLRRLGTVTPGLDRVVEAMVAAGASGARVTGAGFGGYAVAVCVRDRVSAVLAAGQVMGGPAFVVHPSEGLSYD